MRLDGCHQLLQRSASWPCSHTPTLHLAGEGSKLMVQLDLEHRGAAGSAGSNGARASMPATPGAAAAQQPGLDAGAEGEAAGAGGDASEGEEGEEDEGVASEGEASDGEGSFG